MLRTLQFIASHPLTRDRPFAGFARFVRWQIESRLKGEVEFQWIDGAKLLARSGMTGATGNIYCGLHEFADMAFLIHLLRPDDLFVDVGANIGSYTVLASALASAKSIAVEPDPGTMKALMRNVDINGLSTKVTTIEAAVGAQSGTSCFTIGLDTVNHVVNAHHQNARQVKIVRLDEILDDLNPIFIKLDVEGFEAEVIGGASETLGKPSLLAVATEGRGPRVIDPLLRAGFCEVHYDPFMRRFTPEPLFRHSNALYVRDESACLQRLISAPVRTVLGHSL